MQYRKNLTHMTIDTMNPPPHIHVSTEGSDAWSGATPDPRPREDGLTDGPLRTIQAALTVAWSKTIISPHSTTTIIPHLGEDDIRACLCFG